MKRIKRLIGVMLVLALIGGAIGVAVDIYLKDKFIQQITVQIVDEKGRPISANVIINELTENGPILHHHGV